MPVDGADPKVFRVLNAEGKSPFVLLCDHASNHIPEPYGDLGLTPRQRLTHIAWDPGALAVSLQLVEQLDAPLVHSTISRLVIDCNRTEEAADLIPVVSERTRIDANSHITDEERARRIARFHTPFHDAIEALLERRLNAGQETIIVAMHSFTPVYSGVARPWPIGLIHGVDQRLTSALADALRADEPTLNVGWNEPYSARSGVTYTLEHHGDRRALPATMIEIRNDEILEPEGVARWSGRLARTLLAARENWLKTTAMAPPSRQTQQTG